MAGQASLLSALVGGYGAGNTFNPGAIAPFLILRMQTNPVFWKGAMTSMLKDLAMRRVAESKDKFTGPKRLIAAISPELEELKNFHRDLNTLAPKGETTKDWGNMLKSLEDVLGSEGRL